MFDPKLKEALGRVQKPGRYTGGEPGGVYKDKEKVDVRFAFCFPDTYEVGMSFLGEKILYELLNRHENWWCERAFMPWLDMKAEMERLGLPLYTMESKDPLTAFDAVGFTLQYELSYTNILAMLDQPTEGQVYLNGTDTSTIKNKDASSFRREKLGFVFQDFNLLDTLSVKDNILLPLVLSRRSVKEMMSKVESVSRELGIHQLLEKYPYEISGGQKQRVAVARAIITSPEILLADEPTGALDSKSSAALLDVFEDINTMGQTILMVTHSTAAAARAKRVLFIKDGEVFHQIYRGADSLEEMYRKVSDAMTVLTTGGERHA